METVVLGRAQELTQGAKRDTLPGVRSAGHQIVGIREKENADYSIRQDVHMGRQDTPPHLKKYRKSHVNEPGKIQKHWGTADDQPKFSEGHSYGKVNVGSEHVDGVIKAQNLTGLAE